MIADSGSRTPPRENGGSHNAPWALPSGLDAELMPAGRWWDAVRTPAYLGDRVLTLLGDASGAVIRDVHGNRMYWLVRPGAAASWSLPGIADVRVLGTACWVTVPPRHWEREKGLYWAVPVRPGRWYTDTRLLHTALTEAVDAALGPRGGGGVS